MSTSEAGAAEGARLSVCLFCGSSDGARPEYHEAAAEFGRTLAAAKARLVYGGGGIGLMGAAARAAHGAGGAVLGVMPDFLRRREVIYDVVETIVVANMHERKMRMFEESDAFAIFPGGIGTLEEVVELLSWRRLDLHRKPIVFLNLAGFWDPMFALLGHLSAERFMPGWLPDTWRSVGSVAEVLPAIAELRDIAASGPGFFGYEDGDLAKKA
jgi:uncharacterized protein (TIGR00730 family)